MSDGYNGWRNRATWLVVTWFTNDSGLYGYIRETIEGCVADGMTKGEARGELMETIENYVNEMYYDSYDCVEKVGGNFATDLLLTKPEWMDIDYYRIADSMLEDYDDLRSDSIKDTAKAVYGKTKVAAQTGVRKTKAAAGKAKGRVAPKKKAPAKSESQKGKAPNKRQTNRTSGTRRR